MPEPIQIRGDLALDGDEVEFSFIRSSGPGGQNVNKVATAVQLRFDLMHSPSLPDAIKRRTAALAGTRFTNAGEIVITASSHRTQEQNRKAALDRLVQLIREAAVPPKRRIATRPTLASRQRRVEAKARRAETKRGRAGPGLSD